MSEEHAEDARSPLREWVVRVGLVLVSLLLTCVFLELGLRLAASFVGPRPISASADKRVILTLGDSHTYGVFYEPEEAYPGQLQALLDRWAPGRYEVVNLGLPGMNSSQIAARLPRWIAEFRPFMTIVCVGANNVWNRSDTEERQRAGPVRRWFGGLRLARFYSILKLNLEAFASTPPKAGRPDLERVEVTEGESGVEHRDAETGKLLIYHRGVTDQWISREDARQMMRRDLEKILRIDQQQGVQLVLLTYSAFPMPGRPPGNHTHALMSQEMRDFSREHGLPLVDTHDRFRELLGDDVPRAKYFHTETNGHPNPRGYAEIAQLVAEVIEPRQEH